MLADEKKLRAAVERALQEDPYALQIRFDQFVSQANAFKLDERPALCPAAYLTPDNACDGISLLVAIKDVPSFPLLKAMLLKSEPVPSPDIFSHLLYCVPALDALRSVDAARASRFLEASLGGAAVPDGTPHCTVFEFGGGKNRPADAGRFGFHGCQLCDVHEVLADEPAIRVANSLAAAVDDAPMSYGWGKSLLGGVLRTVLACRVPDATQWDDAGTATVDRYAPRFLLVWTTGPPMPITVRSDWPRRLAAFVGGNMDLVGLAFSLSLFVGFSVATDPELSGCFGALFNWAAGRVSRH